jgi:hypothetical protein
MIARDMASPRRGIYSSSLADKIPGILENCNDVMGQLEQTLKKLHPNRRLAPPCYAKNFESFREVYIDNRRHQALDWQEAYARVTNDRDICDDVNAEAKAPFILREIANTDSSRRKFALVGDCYLDGLMQVKRLTMGKVEDICLQ